MKRVSIVLAVCVILGILAACSLRPAPEPQEETLQVSGDSKIVDEETLPEATPITHTLIPGEPYYIGQQSITDCNTGRRLGG